MMGGTDGDGWNECVDEDGVVDSVSREVDDDRWGRCVICMALWGE